MEALITNDIKVSVETFYQERYSQPVEGKYIHAYRITIENLGENTVQLLRRHWFITEGTGLVREVTGDGVIGQQPILEPGESYQYVSWSNLAGSVGKMHGTYTMVDHKSSLEFTVGIPVFQLIAPDILN